MSLSCTSPKSQLQDCFSVICSFLNPYELASAERVNRAWHEMICSEDQDAWKEQCRLQGITVGNSDVEQALGPYIQQALTPYSPVEGRGYFDFRTLSIITSYYENGVDAIRYREVAQVIGPDSTVLSIISSYEKAICYKELAMEVRGDVELNPDSEYLFMGTKGSVLYPLRWGRDENELFVRIDIYSQESRDACEKHHGESCDNYGDQGTWYDIHPRINDFPTRLPLRLFINRDGNLKRAGDKIKLLYQQQRVVLTCTNRGRNNPPTFAEDMARKVTATLSVKPILILAVNSASTAAQTAPEWTSSD